MYRNQQQEHETSIHDKMVDVANMRESYHNDKLHKQELPSDPFEAFDTWLKEAVEAGQAEPNAMTLASVDQNGYPNARMVLLKGYSEQGFSFFTNYCSAKGKELEENNHVALVFWWHACHRQVRIRGQVEKLSAEESDEYFYSRPHDSQVAACASHQSEPLESRKELEDRYRKLSDSDEPVKRPECWGGFRVKPVEIEFWQGQTSRLHDRIVFNRDQDDSWSTTRLNP